MNRLGCLNDLRLLRARRERREEGVGLGVIAHLEAFGSLLCDQLGISLREAPDEEERRRRAHPTQDAQDLGRICAGAVVERKRHLTTAAARELNVWDVAEGRLVHAPGSRGRGAHRPEHRLRLPRAGGRRGSGCLPMPA